MLRCKVCSSVYTFVGNGYYCHGCGSVLRIDKVEVYKNRVTASEEGSRIFKESSDGLFQFSV